MLNAIVPGSSESGLTDPNPPEISEFGADSSGCHAVLGATTCGNGTWPGQCPASCSKSKRTKGTSRMLLSARIRSSLPVLMALSGAPPPPPPPRNPQCVSAQCSSGTHGRSGSSVAVSKSRRQLSCCWLQAAWYHHVLQRCVPAALLEMWRLHLSNTQPRSPICCTTSCLCKAW